MAKQIFYPIKREYFVMSFTEIFMTTVRCEFCGKLDCEQQQPQAESVKEIDFKVSIMLNFGYKISVAYSVSVKSFQNMRFKDSWVP